MREEKIILRKLTAADGYILTNGEVYGKEIYLGKNDKEENWYEISAAEYAIIKAGQEKEDLENV